MVQIINPFESPVHRQGGQLDVQRPPVSHHCPCGFDQVLVLPQAEGACVWRCVKCGREHRLDFRPWDGVIGAQGGYAFHRKPLDHGCDCGQRDIIILPAGYGDIRWTCSGCKDVWGIRFNHQGGKIYKVTSARPTNTIDA